MPAPAFIAGDWGTTHLRLYLCDETGKALDTQSGAGVSGLRGDVGGAFFRAVESWDLVHGKLPAVLCGMIGSTIGWREVAYLNCPARPEAIAKSTLCFAAEGRPIAIAPGLTCRNRLLAPDMMRGEETQILGAIRCEPKLATGRQFLCMPGTHTKWVSLKDGAVEHFLTALTGELFDILHNHSVLVNAAGVPEVVGGPEFSRAFEQTKLYPDAELIHLLFEVRSRQLKGEQGKTRETFVQVILIGDVALVGAPAEYFTIFGVDIKRRSPFPNTFVAELANDWIGYLPNREAHELGGYQTWMGLHSYAEEGTGERVADTAVQMLEELAKSK